MKHTFYIILVILIGSQTNCKEKIIESNNKKSLLNEYKNSFNNQEEFEPNKELNLTIQQIIKLYNSKNQKVINKYIHPNLGLNILFRRGTVDEWSNESELCLLSECYKKSNIPYWFKDELKDQKVTYNDTIKETENPIFIECDSISNKGTFIVNTSNSKYLLSETMKRYIKSHSYDKTFFSKEKLKELNLEILNVYKWEENTRRIVVASSPENSLTFYLTKIEGLWFLSTIDFITFDCSV